MAFGRLAFWPNPSTAAAVFDCSETELRCAQGLRAYSETHYLQYKRTLFACPSRRNDKRLREESVQSFARPRSAGIQMGGDFDGNFQNMLCSMFMDFFKRSTMQQGDALHLTAPDGRGQVKDAAKTGVCLALPFHGPSRQNESAKSEGENASRIFFESGNENDDNHDNDNNGDDGDGSNRSGENIKGLGSTNSASGSGTAREAAATLPYGNDAGIEGRPRACESEDLAACQNALKVSAPEAKSSQAKKRAERAETIAAKRTAATKRGIPGKKVPRPEMPREESEMCSYKGATVTRKITHWKIYVPKRNSPSKKDVNIDRKFKGDAHAAYLGCLDKIDDFLHS